MSSDGSGELSGRANSFLVGIMPALVLILPLFGISFSPEGGTELIGIVVRFIAAVEMIIAIVWQAKAWGKRNFNKENHLGKFAL